MFLAALGAWVILGVVAFVYGSQVEAEVVSMASLQPAYAIVMGIATAVAVVWLRRYAWHSYRPTGRPNGPWPAPPASSRRWSC